MGISCFVINIDNKAKKMLLEIKRSPGFELLGIYTDIQILIGKVIPKDLNPDLVVIDCDTYKEHFHYLEPIRNKARLVMILTNDFFDYRDLVTKHKHKCHHLFCEGKGSKENLSEAADEIQEQLDFEARNGLHHYGENYFEIYLNYYEHKFIYFKDLVTVRRTRDFLFFGVKNETFISRFRLPNFHALANRINFAKVSKDVIIRLGKIHSLNLKTFEIKLTNGDIVNAEEQYRVKLVLLLVWRGNLSVAHADLLNRYLVNDCNFPA